MWIYEYDPVAQSVEHLTFNQVVAGSIPARITTLRPAASGGRSLNEFGLAANHLLVIYGVICANTKMRLVAIALTTKIMHKYE